MYFGLVHARTLPIALAVDESKNTVVIVGTVHKDERFAPVLRTGWLVIRDPRIAKQRVMNWKFYTSILSHQVLASFVAFAATQVWCTVAQLVCVETTTRAGSTLH